MSFTKYQSLEDRVVLVSGGASGIGETFVRAFADNGARVAFLDLQEEAGQALAKSLAGSARHAPLFLRCDVTQIDELKAAITWQVGVPELMGYASAKAAVVGFTHSLARQVGAHRIRVNAIAPGLVLTEKQQRLWYPTAEKVAAVVKSQFLPDTIMPADIARLALFLAADDSRMITKQTFNVNGGRA
jgi:NAD(P)-dependent dehydrogenase (short-subunit alcohol dehydrogenase family)